MGSGHTRVHELLVSEKAVLGSEFSAVMPRYTFAEMESDGLPVGRDVPPLSKVANQPDVLIRFHEAIENEVVDIARCGIVREDRIQPPGIADGTQDDGVGVPLGLLAAGKKKNGYNKYGKKDLVHKKRMGHG